MGTAPDYEDVGPVAPSFRDFLAVFPTRIGQKGGPLRRWLEDVP